MVKPDLWDECSRIVTRYQCRIIAGILAILLPAVGTGMGWYVSANAEMDRIATSADTRSLSTAAALDALTAETRTVNNEITKTLTVIQSDIRLLTFRADNKVFAGQVPPHVGKHE
jgi:hypothetical protein